MLPKPLDIKGYTEPDVYDHLYTFFKRDFVDNDTYIAERYYVDPAHQGYNDGKEEIFWHITTREKKVKVKVGNVYRDKSFGRRFDPERARRIEWIKLILTNHKDPEIKIFYRRETTRKKPIRLYLWAYNSDFVVIVQKLGLTDSFIVTCFFITESYKRNSYQKWHQEYVSKHIAELKGCEWF